MLPKLMGSDFELGNFMLGAGDTRDSAGDAARALLSCIEGLPNARMLAPPPVGTCPCGCGLPSASRTGAGASSAYAGQIRASNVDPAQGVLLMPSSAAPQPRYNPQDIGRKFLVNGGCAYIDLEHCELCTAEVLSALDQVACQHAMLRIAQRALVRANAAQPRGRHVLALFNNSDGRGNSYGSHTNFLVTRTLWDQMFNTRLQLLLYLAAFQVSGIVITGQGKVGSENAQPPVDFQIAQRADFFETLTGVQTTTRRPLVNARDEALCGSHVRDRDSAATAGMARLHVIFFDATFSHVATFLKFGTMQLVLAMLEAGLANPAHLLDDPLGAVAAWSHDPDLMTRARLVGGDDVTAVELQRRFYRDAERFVRAGRADGIVPDADRIIGNWDRVLTLFECRQIDELTGQIDWVLKRASIQQALAKRGLSWQSSEAKHLDLLFSSLDPESGLYWAYERAGLVQPLVTSDVIERFTEFPPEHTRAWTRGELLRRAGPRGVDQADWDRVGISARGLGGWRVVRTVRLSNPLAWTRADSQSVFDANPDVESLATLLETQSSADPTDTDHEGPSRQSRTQGWWKHHDHTREEQNPWN
jgi:Pup amidohydrolase